MQRHERRGILAFPGHMAKNFGGGPGAPLFIFLDGFIKTFALEGKFGKGFLGAIAWTQFASESYTMCLLRIAALAAQATGGKEQDGIYRMFSKQDFEGLRKKAMLRKLEQAEDLLNYGWKHKLASKEPENVTTAAFGKLCVRVMLHLTKKEKHHASLKTVFADFVEIKAKFTKDMLNREDNNPQAGKKASGSGAAASLDNNNDALWILKQKMVLDPKVIYQHCDYEGIGFKLISSDKESLKMKSMPNAKSDESVDIEVKTEGAHKKIKAMKKLVCRSKAS